MQRRTQPTKNKAKVYHLQQVRPVPVTPRSYMVEMKAPYAVKFISVEYRPSDKTYRVSGSKIWVPVPTGSQLRSNTPKAKAKATKAKATKVKVQQPKPVTPQGDSTGLSLKDKLAQKLAIEAQHAAAKRRETRNAPKYQ